MNDKQAKRVESVDEHQDWNTVGSGLLVKHKLNTRDSEPQLTIKQSLDFQNIFNEPSTIASKTAAQVSTADYQSSLKTR